MIFISEIKKLKKKIPLGIEFMYNQMKWSNYSQLITDQKQSKFLDNLIKLLINSTNVRLEIRYKTSEDPAHEVVKPRLPCLKNTIATVVEAFKLQTIFQTLD